MHCIFLSVESPLRSFKKYHPFLSYWCWCISPVTCHVLMSVNNGFPFSSSTVLCCVLCDTRHAAMKIAVSYILSSFLAVKGRRVNLLPVIPSWQEIEICVCVYIFNSFIEMYNWHIVTCTCLKYTIWLLLIHVYTIATIKTTYPLLPKVPALSF